MKIIRLPFFIKISIPALKKTPGPGRIPFSSDLSMPHLQPVLLANASSRDQKHLFKGEIPATGSKNGEFIVRLKILEILHAINPENFKAKF